MEKLIIEKLKAGDEKAFKHIYDRHYVLLCRFANLILNDAFLAEEIVNDVIFYLWEHRADLEIAYSLRAYLLRAVRNRCLNELNTLTHRKEHCFSAFPHSENSNFADSFFVTDEHPLGALLEQELEDLLTRSIEALPEECRAVFIKSRFEQKNYQEISAELNISVNTVKYHIKHALSVLRVEFSEYLQVLLLLI